MANRNTEKQLIDRLRELATTGNTAAFATLLSALLKESFLHWLSITRSQKLLSRFRSASLIAKVRGDLISKELLTMHGKDLKRKLVTHLRVCEFFQHVFSRIDADAQASPIAAAHPDNVALAVLRLVEVTHREMNEAVFQATISEPQSSPTLQRLAFWNRKLRDVMDAALIILNSPVANTGTDCSRSVEDTDLDRLTVMALRYDEIQQAFDAYSYGSADAYTARNRLVLKPCPDNGDMAAAVASERTTDADQVRLIFRDQLEAGIHRDCEGFAPLPPNFSFLSFLLQIHHAHLVPKVRHLGAAIVVDFSEEIDDYFDKNAVITTPAGRFSFAELIRTYAFLQCIAVLARVWNRLRRETDFHAQPIPILSFRFLRRLMSRELGVSAQRADELLTQFASRRNAGQPIDLFYKPLLRLGNDNVIIPTAFVLGGRFERNIFTIAVAESDLDQKGKGLVALQISSATSIRLASRPASTSL